MSVLTHHEGVPADGLDLAVLAGGPGQETQRLELHQVQQLVWGCEDLACALALEHSRPHALGEGAAHRSGLGAVQHLPVGGIGIGKGEGGRAAALHKSLLVFIRLCWVGVADSND